MSRNADDVTPAFLTRAQVARLLGVGAHSVDRSALPRTRLNENGRVLFRRSDVMAYMKQNMTGTPFPDEPEAVPKTAGEAVSVYAPSEKLAAGLMFGSIVTEVFYHNGKISKVIRQRRENYLEKGDGQ